jgi:flagellar assembly protein FliH
VEAEVVRLAVAIAGRILRREAQIDPLLLLGAVRVALGQLAGTTRARLRVPAEHAALWTDAVALLPGRALKPEIVADAAMRLGDCQLESDLGSVDLSAPAQLSEIERRLFHTSPAAEPAAVRSQPANQTESTADRTVSSTDLVVAEQQ